jgi:mRNA interferase RelE/StbE
VSRIEWTEPAIDDLAALDKSPARRVKQAVERFAESGVGDVKKLKAIDPPEYRLRVGDWRVLFEIEGEAVRILRVRHRSQAYR